MRYVLSDFKLRRSLANEVRVAERHRLFQAFFQVRGLTYVVHRSAAQWQPSRPGLSSPRGDVVRTRAPALTENAWAVSSLMRSAHSLRFEALVRDASRAGCLARLNDIALERHAELSGWIAVVHPDARALSLTITHAGASLSAMQADPMAGTDYLDLVDPAFKGEAFDCTFMMLSRPCGLWQMTPVGLADGTSDVFELTGFPVFDEDNRRGVIMFLIWHASLSFHGVTRVGHAQTWAWLELRTGAFAPQA